MSDTCRLRQATHAKERHFVDDPGDDIEGLKLGRTRTADAVVPLFDAWTARVTSRAAAEFP